uniref:Uncharacterized protein n=1 Tax=Lactuca sativa TaxID=4236 RepID=A0A9R1VX54_LACSA|nr:hypothetical protein LSAT_V11C400161040 [Lactuca sativa]
MDEKASNVIRGIFVHGDWVTYPIEVKNEFFDFYSSKFNNFQNILMVARSDRFSSLLPKDVELLEKLFSVKDIKEAVWDCGGDRAPGSDGILFKFLKHFWDVLGDYLLGKRPAFVLPNVICMEQSSFLKGHQILDGPLMVNYGFYGIW